MPDPDYKERWRLAEATIRELHAHYLIPPEAQRRKWRTLRRQYGIASERIRQLKGDVARVQVRFLERAESERQHRVALYALLRAVLGGGIVHENWLSTQVLERALSEIGKMRGENDDGRS
jgi:hypothetical protein